MTLVQVDLLADLADRFPDGVAWKDMGDRRELTLREWHARSNQLARGMLARGLKAGDRVALAITPNQPLEWLTSYMAIHKTGAIAVPLNTRLSRPEQLRILDLAGVKIILASEGILDDSSSTAHLGALVATTGPVGASGVAWADLLDPDPSDIGHPVHVDDVADIMYTSGTTGTPKGVVVRHGGLSSNDRVPEEWTGLGFLMGSPFSTTTGSLLVCGPMRGGMSGWFLPKFDPEGWLRLVETERPTVAMIVPAMMALLVASPSFAQRRPLQLGRRELRECAGDGGDTASVRHTPSGRRDHGRLRHDRVRCGDRTPAGRRREASGLGRRPAARGQLAHRR